MTRLRENPQTMQVQVERGRGDGKTTVTLDLLVHQITDDHGQIIPGALAKTPVFGICVRVRTENCRWQVYFLPEAATQREGIAFAQTHLNARHPEMDVRTGCYHLSIHTHGRNQLVEINLVLADQDLRDLAV